MEETITRKEHEEFARRIDEENNRQNHRIEILENTVHQVSELTSSVKVLAVNMENMLAEQKKQGERLEALEDQDGQTWRNVKWYLITAILGGVVGFFLHQLGM